MEQKGISILLPTRGRKEVLKKSLESLLNKADNPNDLEILFGVECGVGGRRRE